MFAYDKLENYFRTNFAMAQHHGYSISELENMLPWERTIYVQLVSNYVTEENERIRLLQQTQKAKR